MFLFAWGSYNSLACDRMNKNKQRSKKKLPKGRERYIPTQEEVERRNAEITRKPYKDESDEESESGSEIRTPGESAYVTDSQAQSSENDKKNEKKKEQAEEKK
ncbi:conserved Plasmodium protein, unknown function [Plasmodium ovale curtisi]|uniref:Uncharacterized protein n=2 Tax=Plasmodium ovale TaxID=36330 RepID=A0A1A8WP17_PLAOA|nr:conserved Plasmodium protein, unknown function [Plasmodium ovale curtisi]SBT00738.1 conserved Plasmodium protein, unknown function [Plasmodium ovale curtisi]